MQSPNSKQVTWARLKTPYSQWDRHGDEDAAFCEFLIKSGIPVQQSSLTVDATDLRELCRRFLVFATDISYITDRTCLENLREYVYRGGFLYVEVCHDKSVTPSMKVFHDRQIRVFAGLFPTAQVRMLLSKHPIFNSPYPIPEANRNVAPDPNGSELGGATTAFYALYDDDRTIALLGQKGVRCAWGWDQNRTVTKMRLSANALAFAYREAGYG